MRPFSDPQLTAATDDGWRRQWFDIIYRHDTRPSRNFDLMLVVAILASVVVIMIDSVPRIHSHAADWLVPLEWAFTVIFTIEYALRLAVVRRPLHYALSVWGVIDLLSILPSYLSFFVPGAQTLLVVRVLRICGCSAFSNSPATSKKAGNCWMRCGVAVARCWCSCSPCSPSP